MFYGGDLGVPPSMPGRLLGWPDEWSICVIYKGGGVVVRTDVPTETYEIESYPITSALVVPERGMVVFSDWLAMSAIDPVNGLLNTHRRTMT